MDVGTDCDPLMAITSVRDARTEIHPDRAMGQLLSHAVVEADPGARNNRIRVLALLDLTRSEKIL